MDSTAVLERPPVLGNDVAVGSAEAVERTNGSSAVASWTTIGGDHIDPDQIVFIVPPAPWSSSGHYAIYSVQEDAANAEQPFRLSVSRRAFVPSDVRDRHALREVPPHLRSSSTHAVDVIVSTKSGTGLALPCWEHVVQPLISAAGHGTNPGRGFSPHKAAARSGDVGPADGVEEPYRVLVTESARSVREFARERWGRSKAETNGVDLTRTETIVVLSGDGGIVDLLNGSGEVSATTASPRPSIVLLPLGTGNALFHSLHKPVYAEDGGRPTPLVAGLRTLFRGRPAPLPLFRASFSPRSHIVTYTDPNKTGASGGEPVVADLRREETTVQRLLGAIVASYGFHSSIVWESDTPEYRKHGDARFGMVARELLQESHGYKARVEIRRPQQDDVVAGTGDDGWETLPREEFGYVLATLVSNLERKFTISPASKPLGGQLRLVHFGAVGGQRTMEIMTAAYNEGAHVGMTWAVEGEAEGGGQQDGVGYDEIDGLRVTIHEDDPRWRKLCIDGTIVEVEKGGWMTVEQLGGSVFDILVDASISAP